MLTGVPGSLGSIYTSVLNSSVKKRARHISTELTFHCKVLEGGGFDPRILDQQGFQILLGIQRRRYGPSREAKGVVKLKCDLVGYRESSLERLQVDFAKEARAARRHVVAAIDGGLEV